MHTRQFPTIGRRSSEEPRGRGAATDPAAGGDPSATRAPAAATTRRAAPPSLILGRYGLQRRLGTGAFGTVWQARDQRLDREVAIKIVPCERIVGGRFEREARAAARLTHPGIVTLYEAAVDDHGAYLVSELVRGHTMAQLLDWGRLSDQDVVAIGIALCDALSHAHAEGIVHRDVKPSNVLIPERPASQAQLAKLTDFGVARVLGGDSLTRTGDIVGTAAYMAPEQAEGRPAGPTADLYALALVLYEGLTGINPVRTGTAAHRARRLGAHLPPLRRQRRDLPRELGQAIDLALRPKPRERGSVEELREALVRSLGRLADRPGIVAGPWRARSDHAARRGTASEDGPRSAREDGPRSAREDAARSAREDAARSAREDAARSAAADERRRSAAITDLDTQEDPQLTRPTYPWPARAAAGLATTAATAWLAAHVLAPSAAAPAVAAMFAGGLAIVFPRAGWVAMTGALTIAAAWQHRLGGALAILLAGLVPVALLPFDGALWGVPVGAPALGSIGLAGAWPALAARARGAWRRAALAATGWLWLELASSLAGKGLYLTEKTPAPAAWTRSLRLAIHDVLLSLFSAGALAPALVWAVAAVVLPWLVRGRSLVADVVLVAVWAAVVVSATQTVLRVLHYPGHVRTAVLGAVAGALIALGPSIVAFCRDRRAFRPEVRSMESP